MTTWFYRLFFVFPRNLWRIFWYGRLTQVAASLAFSTLLTLVPLTTLVLVVVSSLPGFEALLKHWDQLLVQTLLPGQAGGVVVHHVSLMANRARELAGPWLLFLVFVVGSMLHTLEAALNQIWGVEEGRSWWRRLPMYIIGMVGVPLLMGILASLPSVILYLFSGALRGGGGQWPLLVRGVNLLVLTGFIALFYYALPNVRVRGWSALLGGGLVSLVLAAVQRGFLWYVSQASFYAEVYGAMAALPIFLFWLYLAWVLVLCGGVLVASVDGVFRSRF